MSVMKVSPREIVIRRPDVIVTGTNPVVTAFNAATKTIPVVAFMLDPLHAGLVTNLGNITGITLDPGIEVFREFLEILKEAIPSTTKAAFLGMRGGWEGSSGQVLRDAASRLGISLLFTLPRRELQDGLLGCGGRCLNSRRIASYVWYPTIGRGYGGQTRKASYPAVLHLIAYGFAIALPLVLMMGALLWQTASYERDQSRQQILRTLGALRDSLDRDLDRHLTILQTLAISSALQKQDWPVFTTKLRQRCTAGATCFGRCRVGQAASEHLRSAWAGTAIHR